jgi:RNA polymerase sigma-70 factor, ECF subfamily
MQKIKQDKTIKDLVKRSQAGDKEAFGKLYDVYLKPIFRFVYFRVSNREDAEDLTGQIFLKAWQHIDKYDTNKSFFSSWLYIIARNQVIDHYRQSKKNIELEDWIKETHVQPEILDKVDQEILHKNLLKKTKKLPEKQQEVIILKFFENLSNKEISQIINKKEGAIRILQYRALQNLKIMLNKNEIRE